MPLAIDSRAPSSQSFGGDRLAFRRPTMTGASPKKPWSKPEVRNLGPADSLEAIGEDSPSDLAPAMREALRGLLRGRR